MVDSESWTSDEPLVMLELVLMEATISSYIEWCASVRCLARVCVCAGAPLISRKRLSLCSLAGPRLLFPSNAATQSRG